MKKILLIGKLNEIAKSLNECLVEDFQVQFCSEQLDSIKGMYKVFGPDMMVVSQAAQDDLTDEVMEWLREQRNTMPVLLITKWEYRYQYGSYEQDGKFEKLFRPIRKRELMEKCYTLFDMEVPEKYVLRGVGEKEKILLVDDSPLMLRSLKTILEKKYIVFLAKSGEQALKFVSDKKPDLILLDYEMPEMNGKETYEKLKENQGTKDIPVVFLTSVSAREKVYSALGTNPAGYILKPPSEEKLFETIEEVLEDSDITI